MATPCGLDGPVNGKNFAVYIGDFLMPGSLVVMDNLSSHKGKIIREMIESAGATLLFLPILSTLQPNRKSLRLNESFVTKR